MSNKKNKADSFGVNVGSSSILLIFVILCLVSFAVLSIVSANADKKLSSRVSDRTTAYYKACNQAEEILSGIDTELLKAYASSSNEKEYFDTVGVNRSYNVSINDSQNLYVSLDILYPQSPDEPFYSITAWQAVNTSSGTGTTIIE
jgi:hypothetical protein